MPNAKTLQLSFDDAQCTLRVRKIRGARRMRLSWQPISRAALLTLPSYVSFKEGMRFVESRKAWLARQMESTGAQMPLAPGEIIPVLGERLRIVHAPDIRFITREEDCLMVPGDAAFIRRRVRDWLKARLRQHIAQNAALHAATLGVRLRRISLRDTASRWGSCTSQGHLSFSWRLVFAPQEVIDYLVAHEVAHLREMNHSEAFWRVVASIYPHYAKPRAWLKKHGQELYRYD